MSGQAALLAVTTRGERVESEHFGHLAVCDPAGNLIASHGDPGHWTFPRSSAKPLQAITALEQGAAERFGWTDEEIAVVCASHAAEPMHQVVVRRILARSGLSAAALGCGPHPPIDGGERRRLERAGQAPARIHNNCSGKHAGMLAASVAQGWPTASYLGADHPLQLENRRTLARFAGVPAEEMPVGVDGCGVPTYSLPLAAMATAFARLANPNLAASRDFISPADERAAAAVGAAMIARPDLLAGTGRFNSQLGAFLGARGLAKSGAEGVFCIGLADRALGIALKVSDGSARVHPAIVCRVLRTLLPDLDWAGFEQTQDNRVRNTLRQTVGQIEAVF